MTQKFADFKALVLSELQTILKEPIPGIDVTEKMVEEVKQCENFGQLYSTVDLEDDSNQYFIDWFEKFLEEK